jgi:large subunit ribosomal protein L10
MEKSQKPAVVENLNQVVNGASMLVVTSQTGLTVDQSNKLRAQVKEVGASFRVTKNTLMRLAIKDTKASVLEKFFKGPTGLVAGNDPVATAKAIQDFSAANDKLQILGGMMDGAILSKEQVQALAKLPSLNVLRGQLVGIILAPATKIAGVLQAPAGQLARLMAAKAKKED